MWRIVNVRSQQSAQAAEPENAVKDSDLTSLTLGMQSGKMKATCILGYKDINISGKHSSVRGCRWPQFSFSEKTLSQKQPLDTSFQGSAGRHVLMRPLAEAQNDGAFCFSDRLRHFTGFNPGLLD